MANNSSRPEWNNFTLKLDSPRRLTKYVPFSETESQHSPRVRTPLYPESGSPSKPPIYPPKRKPSDSGPSSPGSGATTPVHKTTGNRYRPPSRSGSHCSSTDFGVHETPRPTTPSISERSNQRARRLSGLSRNSADIVHLEECQSSGHFSSRNSNCGESVISHDDDASSCYGSLPQMEISEDWEELQMLLFKLDTPSSQDFTPLRQIFAPHSYNNVKS